MRDVVQIRRENCPRHEEPLTAQLSLDGVQESRSTSVSLDVYSVQVGNCRDIYPLKIVRPVNKFNLSYKPQLESLLKNLNEWKVAIDAFIADNLKRSNIREFLNHASNFACEYCTSKAVQYSEMNLKAEEEKKKILLQIKQFEKEINFLKQRPTTSSSQNAQDHQLKILNDLITELKRKMSSVSRKPSHPVWPETTINGPLRTKEETLAIADSLRQGNRLSADQAKGVVGRSLFLDLEYFDFVLGIPVEYMHLGCLGVVKRSDKLMRHFFSLLYGTNHLLVITMCFNDIATKIVISRFPLKKQLSLVLCLFSFL